MRIRNAYLEITNRCNLNCITCYNRSGLNLKRQELEFEQLILCLNRLHDEFGCSSFSLAGGEPLLYSSLPQLIEYMQCHPDLSFSFVTNGTVHIPAFIELLRSQPGRFRLQISLDGSCEAINALTRGQGSFDRTIAFLEQIVCSDYKPLVKMVISQKNLADVEPFYHMVVQHGGTPEYAFINRTGNAVEDWESKGLSAVQKIKVLKLLDRLNQENPGVNAVLPRSSSSCPLCDENSPVSVLIKSDGTLQPCQLMYDGSYSLGNLLTDSTEQLMQGMARIRRLALERRARDYECNRCPLHTQCGKGCMASALYQSNDPLGDDGDCTTRKLEILDFEVRRHLSKLSS